MPGWSWCSGSPGSFRFLDHVSWLPLVGPLAEVTAYRYCLPNMATVLCIISNKKKNTKFYIALVSALSCCLYCNKTVKFPGTTLTTE